MGISCFFSTFAAMYRLFTFSSFAFSHILDNLQKTETETKKPYFCRFCHKTSVFVANKVLIFSDLWVYRVNCTLPPPFLALAGWVSSRPKFLIFYFFIFCKILWFFRFRFSTKFWAFSRTSYLFLILHKFSRYLFSLIFVRYGAFYAVSWCSLSQDYFERLRTRILRYFYFFAEK